MKELKDLWVCISYTGFADYSSIAPSKEMSIKYCTSNGMYNWSDYLKIGWECKNVDVTFKEVTNGKI